MTPECTHRAALTRAWHLEAIRRAEQGSRGEVIVHVERHCEGGDALARATTLFQTLGMHRTAADTGVLLYVAMKRRRWLRRWGRQFLLVVRPPTACLRHTTAGA